MGDGRRRFSPEPTRRFLHEITVLVILATLLAMGAVYWRTTVLIDDSALAEARSFVDLVVATRSWNAIHGGVWVTKGPGIETNPFLAELGISADATTTDGQVLTLRNPAIMTREVSSLLARADGATFHLTSLKPVNPANTPDSWERASLEAFDSGSSERWTTGNDSPRGELRYMRPLMTDATCLKCHARQGYRVGHVRGAVSVIVPLGRVGGQALTNAILLGVLGLAFTGVMLGVTLTLVKRLRDALRRAQAELVEAATIDHLTRVANRRHTIDRLTEEIERSRRTGESLGLIMADVDHFKAINDTFGHSAGDAVLAAVAARIGAAMRPYDLLGRIGGEEFLIVAPRTDVAGAVSIAERARARVSEAPVQSGGSVARVGASFGVTLVDPHEPDALDRALARADAAMYEAKDAGRDRVSVRLSDERGLA